MSKMIALLKKRNQVGFIHGWKSLGNIRCFINAAISLRTKKGIWWFFECFSLENGTIDVYLLDGRLKE